MYSAQVHTSTYQQLHLQPLLKFYSQRENMGQLVDILVNHVISLRKIDRFITKTCKQHKLGYRRADQTYFDIYQSYTDQLHLYTKDFFDPFCRKHKLVIELVPEEDDNSDNEQENIRITVSIGQLQFFRWAISNHVLTFMKSYQGPA